MIFVAGAAILVTLLAVDSLALRTLVALPLVLIVPGYALQAALFPARVLSRVERGLFSAGLSVAITMVGGVLLNWSPWGLQATGWALLLGAVTLFASVIAWVRRPRHDGGGVRNRDMPSLRQAALLGLAGAMVIGALALVRTPVSPQGLQGYTALWLLPSASGDQQSVLLGISSSEFATTRYRLQIEMNRRLIQEWPSIELGTGQRWEQQVELPAELPDGMVEAVLYRLDAPEVVYRRATLWRTTK